MNIFRVVVLGVAISLAASAPAATLLLEWDVAKPGSWKWDDAVNDKHGAWVVASSGGIADAGSMMPRDGWAYVDGGAGQVAGSLDRPYIEFVSMAYVTIEGQRYDYTLFEHADRTGYSLVGYLYFSATGLHSQDNTGIGSAHDPYQQSLFLYYSPRDDGSLLQSRTHMTRRDAFPSPSDSDRWVQRDFVEEKIDQPMRGEWIQFVKVFDMEAGEIRYYLNGNPVPVLVAPVVGIDLDDYVFEGRGDVLGCFGSSGRRLEGMAFSYFAVYDGVLSVEEIRASYQYLTGVPEPATMSLLALGGLAMLRRRR